VYDVRASPIYIYSWDGRFGGAFLACTLATVMGEPPGSDTWWWKVVGAGGGAAAPQVRPHPGWHLPAPPFMRAVSEWAWAMSLWVLPPESSGTWALLLFFLECAFSDCVF